jgi:LAGLIDADG endonuclease
LNVDSDKPPGADNQQERPGFAQWVVGFVDGEGCFSAPIFRNRTCRIGWQVQPTFAVVQAERSVQGLHLLEHYFGCGQVGRFDRHDNHREPLCRYVVRRLADLEFRIIPFFEEHPLVTAKANDFSKFAAIVRMMRRGRHLEVGGLAEIARIVETMNRRQPSRFLESSEAIRQPRRDDNRREDMVRTP